MSNISQMPKTHDRQAGYSAGANAETVRRGYAAFNAADVDTLLNILDEKASWHTPGRTSIGGSRAGRDAVLTQFGRYGAESNGTFRADLLNVFEAGDGSVVALHRNTAERNGRSLDVLCCIVFELSMGRVMSGRECFYDLYAWDEFWS